MKIAILLSALWSIDLSNAIEGKATMYGGNLDGNACGMDGTAPNFDNIDFVAIGSDWFNDGYGCGTCFEVTCKGAYGSNPNCACGSSPTVTVQAIDQCPECSGSKTGFTHFDLNAGAMAKITGSADMAGLCGVITVDYKRVDCSTGTSNFYVKNKGGTSKWWYGMHLNNVNDDGGILTVDLYKNGNKVGYCNKNQGPSFWICTASGGEFPDPPLSLKVTSDRGASVMAENCITSFDGGKIMQCNTNLGSGGSGSTPTTTTTTTRAGTTTTTTTTTSNGNGNGNGKKLKITNKKGLNQWWYAVTLDDEPESGIQWVKMKDSKMSSYEKGTKEWDYFKFTGNTPYSPPFSFKVRSKKGQTITTTNVIGNLNEGTSGYLSTAFSDAYTEESGDDTSSFPVAAIIAIVLILIIIIGVAGYCFIKRRKQKNAVSFNGGDNYAAGDTPTNRAGENKTAGYDMSTIDVEVEANNEATR